MIVQNEALVIERRWLDPGGVGVVSFIGAIGALFGIADNCANAAAPPCT